ncbi:MAG TPA: cell division protein FtsW [Candidatus Avacidaminococcus intestinavium]|uniref:Probable peptidoglycan glycosyltransferase FtsW n=1 Tax=Candidatus Avacidaminococcus intestinavium TaxID=2840684 RepID=A0A9D1MQT8_9FIRM|nr:cell division protein FtsW [Candidatus Avacidaminococcus intestinavium]
MYKRFLIWDNPKDAILVLTLLLMTLGCINVFSASFVEAKDMFDNGYYYLYRYAGFGLAGLGLMAFLGWGPSYKVWLRHRQIWYLILLVVLICVDLFGVTNKGAQRWLYIGGLSIQPSELVKLGIIVLGAGSLGEFLKRGQRVSLFQINKCLPLMQAVAFAGLVLIQPDMGTAAIILALMFGLYIVAGLPLMQLMLLLGCGVILAVGFVLVAPYRLARVQIWFDPWQDAGNTGYQMVQALMSIGSGGLFGTSFGMGTGKFFYLPEAHTDFAFAIFCQEWGLAGATLLIVLFLLLGAAIQQIALNTQSEEAFLLVTGINFLIVGQAVANMAMVCGLLPVIGVPLTFISYGGTALVVSLAALGLVINIFYAEAKQQQEKVNVAAAFEERKQELLKRRGRFRGWQK